MRGYQFPRSWMLGVLLAGGLFGGPISSVTVAGSFQSEAGCSGDWQADCALTRMTLGDDGVWRLNLALPAGSFEYKVAINDTFAENYGLNGVLNGLSIGLNLAAPTSVRFYFEPVVHNPTDNVNSLIVSAPGDYQSELGCPGDWVPQCLRTWLQDPDGDGVYVFSTNGIPAGFYNFKFTLDESWTVNYGANGEEGGFNIPFNLPSNNLLTTFTFDGATRIGTVSIGTAAIPEPSTVFLLGAGLAAVFGMRRRG